MFLELFGCVVTVRGVNEDDEDGDRKGLEEGDGFRFMKSGALLCPTPTLIPVPPFSAMSGVGLIDTAPTLAGLRSLDTCVLEVEVALAPPNNACAIFSLSVSSLTSSTVAPFFSSLTSDVLGMEGGEDLALLGAGWGRDWGRGRGSGFLPHT